MVCTSVHPTALRRRDLSYGDTFIKFVSFGKDSFEMADDWGRFRPNELWRPTDNRCATSSYVENRGAPESGAPLRKLQCAP